MCQTKRSKPTFLSAPDSLVADGSFCSGPAGANVNAAKLHETALHHAAKVKNVDLIEMLIEFGGNIYARDNRGKKPSDYTWSSSPPAKCFEHYESEARSALPALRMTRGPLALPGRPLCTTHSRSFRSKHTISD